MHGTDLRKRILAALALVVAALVLCSNAMPATPRQQQYGNAAATETTPASLTKTTPASQGTGLPFTGLQLGVATALGVALMVVGLGVHRAGRRRGG